MPVETPGARRVALVVALGVPLGLALFWMVLRDRPPDWDCFETKPRNQDARVDEFRTGAGSTFVVSTVLVMATACVASAWVQERRGRPRRADPATLAVAVGGVVLATVCAVANDAFVVVGYAGVLLVVASPVVALVVLIALVLAVRAGPPLRGVLVLRILCWTAGLVALPVLANWVVATGAEPLLCLD